MVLIRYSVKFWLAAHHSVRYTVADWLMLGNNEKATSQFHIAVIGEGCFARWRWGLSDLELNYIHFNIRGRQWLLCFWIPELIPQHCGLYLVNVFFLIINSDFETEVYIAVKYIPPANSTSSNMTDWLATTTPAPVRKRRQAAATTTPMPETTTVGEIIEEMVESVFYQMEFYTAQCKIWNHYIQVCITFLRQWARLLLFFVLIFSCGDISLHSHVNVPIFWGTCSPYFDFG